MPGTALGVYAPSCRSRQKLDWMFATQEFWGYNWGSNVQWSPWGSLLTSWVVSQCPRDPRLGGLLGNVQTVGWWDGGDPGRAEREGKLAQVTRVSLPASQSCLGLRPVQKVRSVIPLVRHLLPDWPWPLCQIH